MLPKSDTAILLGPGVLCEITPSQRRSSASPCPLPAGDPGWQKSLFPVGGQGCVYFAINKEQRKWQGACGWLWGTKIPALPRVLLIAGPGVGGVSTPSIISQQSASFLARSRAAADGPILQERPGARPRSNRPPGSLRSGVTSTDSPLFIEGAIGRPRDQDHASLRDQPLLVPRHAICKVRTVSLCPTRGYGRPPLMKAGRLGGHWKC